MTPQSRALSLSPENLWKYLRGKLSPARIMINQAVADLMPRLQGEIIEMGATAKGNHSRFAKGNKYILSNVTREKEYLYLDATQMDLPDNSVDSFVSVSVLEHIPEPWEAAREIYRTLKPGGRILLIVPFIFPFHAAPSDYYRFTDVALSSLFRDFEVIHKETLGNFFSTTALFLQRPFEWSTRGKPNEGKRRHTLGRHLVLVVSRAFGVVFYIASRVVHAPDDYPCLHCLLLEKTKLGESS